MPIVWEEVDYFSNFMFKRIWLITGILIGLYLVLPGPSLPPPDLPLSVKSDQPGDTVQIPHVAAYFTNQKRSEVLSFYTRYFSRSSFLGFPLPTYRLNHPPEYAKKVWVETKRSYYLEEVVHPFRESLFVNGYEWKNDVFTKPTKREKNKLIFAGKVWEAKVSLRWFYSPGWARIFVFLLSWIAFYFLIKMWAREIKELIVKAKTTRG